jgi:hypothetical protein
MSNPTSVARQAGHSTPVEFLGRAGMVCYGVVHLLVAYLGIQVAVTGGSDQQADQKGALKEVAETPFGGFALWVLAIGLFAFALWQATLAISGYNWRNKKRTRIFKRIGAAVRVVISIFVAIAAIGIVTGDSDSGGGGGQTQQTFTAKVLELPAGPFLVGLAALVVLGFGVTGISSGVRRSFMKDLDTTELPAGSQKWVRRLGMIGYIAKGVAVSIIGILLGIAAIEADPGEAGGLDAALRTLAAQPFGPVLLAVVAVGLAAFGVYCFAAARSHRT